MKPYLLLSFVLTIIGHCSVAQNIDEFQVQTFKKIIMSPHITLVLEQGAKEAVTIKSEGIKKEKIHVDIDGSTLRIYLENARMSPGHDKRYNGGSSLPMYEGADVQAFVTYRELKKLSVRGDEKVLCESPLEGKKFKLKMFGEADVTLSSVETRKFKASMFGENDLQIESGNSKIQKYNSFGENKVDAYHFESAYVKTNSFGESKFHVFATEVLRVSTFGESVVKYDGGAQLEKGLIFGENRIYRR